MKLVNLEPSDARHVVLWVSPKGEVFSAFLDTADEVEENFFSGLNPNNAAYNSLTEIARMICEENKISCSSPRTYLLNQGWIHYCQVYGTWVWYGMKLNLSQLTVAKQIDNNESLRLLIDRLR